MNWQIVKYVDNVEKNVGKAGDWNKIQRKYERLVARNPDIRYAIGRT